MKTLIPPSHYHRDAIFELEKITLFSSLWQYAGVTDNLLHHQDYICTDINGKNIVIMNFHGTLKAFHNVCSHRLNRICVHATGNGPLQCQYHGWAYNQDGLPYAIPNRKNFESLDPESLKLKQFKVETCGKFVFINNDDLSLSLSDYLKDTYPVIAKISESLGKKIDTNEILINANWKIVVENTLEGYHVNMVHPQTIKKLGFMERSFQYAFPHSSTLEKFQTKLANNKKIEQVYQTRKLQVDDYFHQLIFPNLTFASAYGTTISIQQIIPLSATQTRFVSHVFAAHLETEQTTSDAAVIKAFNNIAIQFNRNVFLEDKGVCENVQLGMTESDRTHGVLCQDEQRIEAFHQAYLHYLPNKEYAT